MPKSGIWKKVFFFPDFEQKKLRVKVIWSVERLAALLAEVHLTAICAVRRPVCAFARSVTGLFLLLYGILQHRTKKR